MSGPIPGNRLRPALWGSALISLLLVGGMVLVQAFGSTSSSRTYVVFLVNVMLVVSIQTFIGNSGIVSFGHVAFMGIGAYTTALVTIPEVIKAAQLPDLPSALATADSRAACRRSRCRRWPRSSWRRSSAARMIRMTESTMAMATLALLVVVHTFFQNATTFTRGSLGLAGIPVRTTLGVATVGAVAFLLVGRLYKESGAGLRLRATREDPLSAASVGTNVVRTRYGAWILSAAMMGAAGSLWAQSVIAFNANQFYFSITFALLAMLVIGGRTSLTGAVAGAAIITFLTDTLARVEQGVAIGPWELPRITGTVQFAIALLIIITLILRPEGMFDRWEIDDLVRRLRRPRRTRRADAARRTERGSRRRRAVGGSTVDERRAGPAGRAASRSASRASRPSPASTSRCASGEILGLIGPNGSGKTTLLNVVSGVLRADRRHASSFHDDEIGGRKPHRVAQLGLSRTFQNIRLFAQLTVRENVEAADRPRHRASRRSTRCSPGSASAPSSARRP